MFLPLSFRESSDFLSALFKLIPFHFGAFSPMSVDLENSIFETNLFWLFQKYTILAFNFSFQVVVHLYLLEKGYLHPFPLFKQFSSLNECSWIDSWLQPLSSKCLHKQSWSLQSNIHILYLSKIFIYFLSFFISSLLIWRSQVKITIKPT